jgi:hypothetical protein
MGARRRLVWDREKLVCTDDSPFLADSYRSEVTLMCRVADVELTTVNPKCDCTSVPSFFELDGAACGEHHVTDLGRSKRHDER